LLKGIKRIALTALSSVMFSTGCAVGAIGNREKNTTIKEEFIYREENETVILKLENGKETTMQFGEKSVKVLKSYKAKKEKESEEIVLFIRWYADQKGYEVTRNIEDMIGEYRLHNYLYTLGYKRTQTCDSDLEYDMDKRWYVAEISKILGWCGF